MAASSSSPSSNLASGRSAPIGDVHEVPGRRSAPAAHLERTMTVATPSGTVRYLHTIGKLAQSGNGFNAPADLAIAPGGRLYVLSRANMAHAPKDYLRITICTLEEEYIGQFTTFGYDDGELVWP